MHDRLSDVRSNQEALEWYQSHSPKDADVAAHHVECLINQGNFWDHSGYPEHALEFTQQAILVGKLHSFDSPAVPSDTVSAMYRAGHLLCVLGPYDDAVIASLDAIDFARTVWPTLAIW